jgi:hypothetical protein
MTQINLKIKRRWPTVALGQNRPAQPNWPGCSWAGGPLSRNRGRPSHGAGRRRRLSESGEQAARTGRGGGARGASECGGPDLRCGEVRGSRRFSLASVQSELRGALMRGHSVGCGSRLAVRGGDPHRRDARGRVSGAIPWLEVPVRGEVHLGDNGGAWIFEDAPRCGAHA